MKKFNENITQKDVRGFRRTAFVSAGIGGYAWIMDSRGTATLVAILMLASIGLSFYCQSKINKKER